MESKDIRFSEKKVDESWKDQATRDRERFDSGAVKPSSSSAANSQAAKSPAKTSKAFIELISSLGYQAMFHLGEIPDPRTGQAEVNLEGAKEAIDLLLAIREKTQNNLSSEETQVLQQILPELQLKFSQKS